MEHKNKTAWDAHSLLDVEDKLVYETSTLSVFHCAIHKVQRVRGKFCFSLFDLIICVLDS